jgi:hypothetical protein
MSHAEIQERSAQVGRAAKRLGVNMFISPIVDVVVGMQPWLTGRALGPDAKQGPHCLRLYPRCAIARRRGHGETLPRLPRALE